MTIYLKKTYLGNKFFSSRIQLFIQVRQPELTLTFRNDTLQLMGDIPHSHFDEPTHCVTQPCEGEGDVVHL